MRSPVSCETARECVFGTIGLDAAADRGRFCGRAFRGGGREGADGGFESAAVRSDIVGGGVEGEARDRMRMGDMCLLFGGFAKTPEEPIGSCWISDRPLLDW